MNNTVPRVIAMSRKAKVVVALVVIVTVIIVLAAISAMQPQEPEETPTRGEAIPSDAVKMTPETDLMPPVLHSDEWLDPVPMTGPINTAGAEDSPFVLPDGNTMFFFFTPDVSVPPEKQLLDKVTGIWWSKKVAGQLDRARADHPQRRPGPRRRAVRPGKQDVVRLREGRELRAR